MTIVKGTFCGINFKNINFSINPHTPNNTTNTWHEENKIKKWKKYNFHLTTFN